jgi:hypothetical protein
MSPIARGSIRIVASGLAASLTWWAGLAAVFGPAQRFLADPERQSEKFLAAFMEPPLPRMAEQPEALAIGLLLIGLIHACVYAWLYPKLGATVLKRGLSFGVMAWALMVPWFEFYLPWNVMREPFGLVLLEGLCWLVVLLGVGLSISLVFHFAGGQVTTRTSVRR